MGRIHRWGRDRNAYDAYTRLVWLSRVCRPSRPIPPSPKSGRCGDDEDVSSGFTGDLVAVHIRVIAAYGLGVEAGEDVLEMEIKVLMM